MEGVPPDQLCWVLVGGAVQSLRLVRPSAPETGFLLITHFSPSSYQSMSNKEPPGSMGSLPKYKRSARARSYSRISGHDMLTSLEGILMPKTQIKPSEHYVRPK